MYPSCTVAGCSAQRATWIEAYPGRDVNMGHTRSHWVTLGHTRSHWVTVGHTRSHWGKVGHMAVSHRGSHWHHLLAPCTYAWDSLRRLMTDAGQASPPPTPNNEKLSKIRQAAPP